MLELVKFSAFVAAFLLGMSSQSMAGRLWQECTQSYLDYDSRMSMSFSRDNSSGVCMFAVSMPAKYASADEPLGRATVSFASLDGREPGERRQILENELVPALYDTMAIQLAGKELGERGGSRLFAALKENFAAVQQCVADAADRKRYKGSFEGGLSIDCGFQEETRTFQVVAALGDIQFQLTLAST